MTGYLASSKAGHDKGKLYVITAQDGEYVWLSDGKGRTVDRPKKKKKKHIQIIKVFENKDLKERLLLGKRVTDSEISDFMKEYQLKQRGIQEESECLSPM